MSDLPRQIEEAEARLAQLRLLAKTAACLEAGHDWQFYGGRNAGCDDNCQCSVPVYFCAKCGDYDYGDNAEAAEKIAACQEEEA